MNELENIGRVNYDRQSMLIEDKQGRTIANVGDCDCDYDTHKLGQLIADAINEKVEKEYK